MYPVPVTFVVTSQTFGPGLPLEEYAAPSLFGPAGRLPSLQFTRITENVYLCVHTPLCRLAFAFSWGVIAAAV